MKTQSPENIKSATQQSRFHQHKQLHSEQCNPGLCLLFLQCDPSPTPLCGTNPGARRYASSGMWKNAAVMLLDTSGAQPATRGCEQVDGISMLKHEAAACLLRVCAPTHTRAHSHMHAQSEALLHTCRRVVSRPCLSECCIVEAYLSQMLQLPVE